MACQPGPCVAGPVLPESNAGPGCVLAVPRNVTIPISPLCGGVIFREHAVGRHRRRSRLDVSEVTKEVGSYHGSTVRHA